MTKLTREDDVQMKDAYSNMQVKKRHTKLLKLVNTYGHRKFPDVAALFTSQHNGVDAINAALRSFSQEIDRDMDAPLQLSFTSTVKFETKRKKPAFFNLNVEFEESPAILGRPC